MNKIKKIIIEKHELDFMLVEKGDFFVGSNIEQLENTKKELHNIGTMIKIEWLLKEYPMHSVYLESFYILKTVIPKSLKEVFLNNIVRDEDKSIPAEFIEYTEAEDFCLWLSQKSGINITIPTEYEWEKAARGNDKREYPWGNLFNQSICNTKLLHKEDFVNIYSFTEANSPYGCIQMGGNIEEWTSSLYEPYPGGEYIEDNFSKNTFNRIIRGGNYRASADLARCARRHGVYAKTVVGLRPIIRGDK